jgi:hypothetical protein
MPTRAWLDREVATAYVPPTSPSAADAPSSGVVWVGTLEVIRALREDFAQCTTDEWLSVALHELFHVWQLRHPGFAAELRAIADGSLAPDAIRALFEHDARYRELVQREYASLVDAVSSPTDPTRARRALRAWWSLHLERRAYLLSQPDGARRMKEDRVFTGLEGVARYVESRFLVDPAQHPTGGIVGDASFHGFARYAQGGYAVMQNRQLDAAYDYAIGFHLALLLDQVEPGWHARLATQPDGLIGLCEALLGDSHGVLPRRHLERTQTATP